MQRYVISKIIGTGEGEDFNRPAVADVPFTNCSQVLPVWPADPNNPLQGKPKYGFTLCFIATSNLSTVASVNHTFVFPDYGLDGRMDGMETGARASLVQSLQAYNLDGNGLHFDASHNDADSYRSLIESIGQQLEPTFLLSQMNVSEVSA